MNGKHGEITVGLVVAVMIGIIVALILFQASAVNVSQSTNTVDMNRTFTAPAVNSSIDLQGQELITTPYVEWNHSCSNVTATLGAGNYTIAEGVSKTDGLKRIYLNVTDKAALSECGTIAGRTWRIVYTFGPEGYADDTGARAIIDLILILAAIAVAIFVLYPSMRENYGWS